MIEVNKISGMGEYEVREEKVRPDKDEMRKLYLVNGKVFLVENKNTLEVRCDKKLGKLLAEKYESVMESRYYGRGGIEIVNAGQLDATEVEDLVRLSYNMTAEMEDK